MMNYKIRPAQPEDMERILEIYEYARAFMRRTGNPHQWGTNHPPRSLLEEDIREQKLQVVTEEGRIHGVFFFTTEPDPTYRYIENGSWMDDSLYGTIHRIAGDGSGGILAAAVQFGKGVTNHLRIDTHKDNRVMQAAIQKVGFRERGIIYISDGSPRIAYEMI